MCANHPDYGKIERRTFLGSCTHCVREDKESGIRHVIIRITDRNRKQIELFDKIVIVPTSPFKGEDLKRRIVFIHTGNEGNREQVEGFLCALNPKDWEGVLIPPAL